MSTETNGSFLVSTQEMQELTTQSTVARANNLDNLFSSPQALDTLQLLDQHGLRASNQLQSTNKIGGAQKHLNEVLRLVHNSHLL